jgi:hypothetical protein
MLISSRIKRQREFLLWFELKYGLQTHEIPGQSLPRLAKMTNTLQALILVHQPRCYWCNQLIFRESIELDVDHVTLHHVDEDRDHNTVDNLEMCHRTCHQTMHKLATGLTMSTATLWGLVKKGDVDARVPIEQQGIRTGEAIPGIGRG